MASPPDLHKIAGKQPGGHLRYNPSNQGESFTPGGDLTAAIVDYAHRVQSYNGVAYSYDAEGNLIRRDFSDGSAYVYEYDFHQRLTAVREGFGQGATRDSLAEERQAVTYRYDGLGRRVEEVWTDQNGTLTTRYAYDGDNVWADLDNQNRLSQRRLYGPGTDQPLAVLTPDSSPRGYTVNWYGQDLLGNIRWVFTSAGDPLQQLTYTPFGGRAAVDSLGNATTPFDRYGYRGREHDRLDNLIYLRNRTLHVTTGQFLQEDPKGFAAGDFNVRRYAGNDPINRSDPFGLDWADWVNAWAPYRNDDWFAQLSNFGAGAGDTVSGGLTGYLRQAAGFDDVVDRESTAYGVGVKTGMVLNIGLMFANPLQVGQAAKGFFSTGGRAGGWQRAFTGVNLTQAAGGAIGGIQAAGQIYQDPFNGSAWLQAGLGFTGMASSALRGVKLCNLDATSQVLGRGALIGGVGLGAWTAAEKFADGDFVGGTLEAIQAALSTRQLLQACFVEGTQLETINGWRSVESLQVGEKLLSRDEHDPTAPVVESVIEEVFVRTGKVVWLCLANGARIGTTLEHPFFDISRGWSEVAHLRAGDELALRDGGTVRVEAIVEDGEYATVYNFRIVGTHTYFVGGEGVGSVWAHNANCTITRSETTDELVLKRVDGTELHRGNMQQLAEFVQQHNANPANAADLLTIRARHHTSVAKMRDIEDTGAIVYSPRDRVPGVHAELEPFGSVNPGQVIRETGAARAGGIVDFDILPSDKWRVTTREVVNVGNRETIVISKASNEKILTYEGAAHPEMPLRGRNPDFTTARTVQAAELAAKPFFTRMWSHIKDWWNG
jgi:RHS repeat-associated protein